MQTIATTLTRDEQAGQLVWIDGFGNLRITDGIFWLGASHRPRVLWKKNRTARAELFCNQDDVCRFKPRA